MRLVIILGLVSPCLFACGDDAGTGSAPDAAADAGAADATTPGDDAPLPRRVVADPVRAERGEEALTDARGAEVPLMGLRSLWVVWGTFGLSDADYWSAFAERYGFVPREGSPYPWGIEVDGSTANIQCLACHVDRVAGEAVIGAGNGRIDLQSLYEDLVTLAEVAPSYGFTVPPIPEIWTEAFADRTGAPGATDAFGMGMTLAAAYRPSTSPETRYGYQQPPAWWQLPFKDRIYTDGMAPSTNPKLMMATTLSSGATLAELMAMEEDFEDVRHYLLSLEPPPWPFDPPDATEVDEGRAVFDRMCASCHGVYAGAEGSYPDSILDVGTDPVRHERFTAAEADWINESWFGEPPVMDGEGYLAPPLVGVWATAPYLHNGSVPDLRALLRSDERPSQWSRVADPDDYDPVRVGIRTTGGSDFDTSREGLSAAGHTYGDALTDAEVDAVLAYLKTL